MVVLPLYWDAMVRSLGLLPVAHLMVVSQNVIKIHKQLRVGGGSGTPGQINISPFSLDRDYNSMYNRTLLHEIGHKIDHYYRSFDHMSVHDQELMKQIMHRGATAGSSEGYADCYMDYFFGGSTRFNLPFRLGNLTLHVNGRTIIYTAPEVNKKRLEAFLSVPPM